MSTLFPAALIATLGCPKDGQALTLQSAVAAVDAVEEGAAVCARCGSAYQIRGGILRLFSDESLDEESRREVKARDERARDIDPTADPWWTNLDDEMEIGSTLNALGVEPNELLLELGCGDGRFTVLLPARCRALAALDFSIQSLSALQRRLPAGTRIGLIHADVTAFNVVPGMFDTVFSTLVSNLPTLAHRQALYALAAKALKPNGKFLYSVHHYGLKERIRGEAKSGYYSEGDIYRYLFTERECREELTNYFHLARVRFVKIYLPFARRLRLPLLRTSIILERVPFLSKLGALMICTARRPRM
jgi:SAM-dependent methyltransferase